MSSLLPTHSAIPVYSLRKITRTLHDSISRVATGLKVLGGNDAASQSVANSLLAIMLYTGCNLYELMGLETSDIYLDKFQSFIIIRNNSIRQIKNVYKIRTIPLVGISRHGAQFLFNKLNEGEILFEKKKITKVENLIKKILIINAKTKSLSSIKLFLVSRLIKIECPEEVILEIIGRSKKDNLYNREISLDLKKSWLEQLQF